MAYDHTGTLRWTIAADLENRGRRGMTETRQSAQDAPGHGPQPEDETTHTPADEREHPEESETDTSALAARRASLSKEIRAGWRRALGH